jgi:mercuric ion transport protein
MITVELLFFPDCPNVDPARDQLRRALEAEALPESWTEHDVTAADAPRHLRGHGSPTILVNGRDVTGAEPGAGASCRLYAGSDQPGVPPLAAVVLALRAARAAQDAAADSAARSPCRCTTLDDSGTRS